VRTRSRATGEEVALKVFARLSADEWKRYHDEVRNAQRLSSPYIVRTYSPFPRRTFAWIEMEWVDGPNLRQVLEEDQPPLTVSRAAAIGADVARALAIAHAEGIVHRDVKPANVLLADGVAKVADFGIARAIDSRAGLTLPGMIIGTANYLSPEQAQGLPVDHRTDLYSLGMVLYEMLTGSPPFTGDNPVAVAYKQQHESALPPSSHNRAVSPRLDAIVAKLLSLNPVNRPSSADQIRAELLAADDDPRAGQSTVAFGMAETTVVPIVSGGGAVGGMGAAAEAAEVAAAAGGAVGAVAAGGGGAGGTGGAGGGGGGGGGARGGGIAPGQGGPSVAPTAMAPVAGAAAGSAAASSRAASTPPNQTPRAVFRRRRTIALGGLVLAVLAAVVAVLALSRGGGSSATTVPRVVGLSVADATSKLNASGLKSQVVKSDVPGVPDQVIQQVPVDGSQAKRGDLVSLYVPSGTTTTTAFPRSTTRPTPRATTGSTVAPTTVTHPATTVPATTPVVTTVPFTLLPTTPTT